MSDLMVRAETLVCAVPAACRLGGRYAAAVRDDLTRHWPALHPEQQRHVQWEIRASLREHATFTDADSEAWRALHVDLTGEQP